MLIWQDQRNASTFLAIVAFLALMSSSSPTRAAYVWQDDRDANGLACFNVGTLQINNMSGGGVQCVETDNAGNLFPAACSAGGGVSSVTGTATRISATPTTGAVVVDLIATAVTPGSYVYASFTVDAYGRLTAASSGTVPVTSVTGTAQRISVAPTTGTPVVDTIGGFYSGAVAAGNENLGASLTTGLIKGNVSGGVCSMSTAVVGTDYQAPLTACTNYVSLSCVSGTTDLGGTNATPTVIGVENGAQVRGKVNIAFSAAPSLPASGQTCWSDSANQVLECIDSLSNRSVVPLIFGCGGSHWVNSLAATGVTSCTQPAFTDLSGSASCAQLPALTGAITSPGGSCATSYAGLPTVSQVMISAGPAATPVGDSTHTFDRVVHVQAAGNAVGVNGVSVPTSVNLCVGHTTATDRDRSQFFLGGGSLGPTGAGVDSTLFDVIPSNTTINLGVGVLGGIYATQRIHSLSYPGGGIGCAVSVAASLYIDAAPTLVVAAGPTYAIYAASGAAHVAGAIDSGSTVSGHSVIATGTAGTAFSANGDTGPTLGFFGASPLGQQTGGAAVAGGTYTATEAAMINRMYAAMRAYGLLN